MRFALPASLALHLGLLGVAWLALDRPAVPEETGLEAVAVDIVSIETFEGSEASTVQSSASQALVAAGARPVEETHATEPPEPPEPVEVAEPKPKPVEVTPPQPAEPAPPTAFKEKPADSPGAATPLVATAAVEERTVPPTPPEAPVEAASPAPEAEAEPAESVPQVEAPLPRKRPKTLPERQTTEPAPEPEEQASPSTEKPKDGPPTRIAASDGDGGKADATVAAAPASASKARGTAAGGSAAADKYPGLVQRALKRALRFPKGAGRARGEVQVTFVVAASGSASRISVTRSSGHPVLDREAIATVKRAAPFPPIPEAAGRSSWTFTMPLLFAR